MREWHYPGLLHSSVFKNLQQFQNKRPTLIAVTVAVNLAVSEWNDGRHKTWKRILEMTNLPFSTSLSEHLEDKDKNRELQRKKRASAKEQAQIARKIEEILETAAAAKTETNKDLREGDLTPDTKKKQSKSRYRLSPQKSANKKSRKKDHNNDTYGGDYGLDS